MLLQKGLLYDLFLKGKALQNVGTFPQNAVKSQAEMVFHLHGRICDVFLYHEIDFRTKLVSGPRRLISKRVFYAHTELFKLVSVNNRYVLEQA